MIRECLVVEFRVEGDECPLADATRANDVTVEAAPPLRRDDGYALLRFSSASRAVGDHLDRDERIRYLHRAPTDDRWTYRCLSKHLCIVHDLIDMGFLAESVRFRNGEEHHRGAVVGHEVLQGVLAAAGEAVGVAIERVTPLNATEDADIAGRWDLTPAQVEALRAAHAAGYFTVPREADAGAVAAELGISKSAFLERLRRGQDALFGQMFG